MAKHQVGDVSAMCGFAACHGVAAPGEASGPLLPPAAFVSESNAPSEEYVIGPLDSLTIFVWRNPELGAKVQVRPDGRITTPLITDMQATGKTPSQLAADITVELKQYIAKSARVGHRRQFFGYLFSTGSHCRRDRKAGFDPISRQHDVARRNDRGWRA